MYESMYEEIVHYFYRQNIDYCEIKSILDNKKHVLLFNEKKRN